MSGRTRAKDKGKQGTRHEGRERNGQAEHTKKQVREKQEAGEEEAEGKINKVKDTINVKRGHTEDWTGI